MQQAIYEPKGRALEYSFLACNLYAGCSHRCDYCFAPGCLRQTKEKFHSHVEPRKGILEQLRKDAPKYAGTNKRVLLCFHCDPYSPEAAASGMTREALKILREHKIPFQVLTKGGTRAAADFDLYGPNDAFAVTLTAPGDELGLWEKYEPGAAEPYDRIDAIREAKRRGITTWVSLEPVLNPVLSHRVITETHGIADLFRVGKMNHDPKREAEIDWRDFAYRAMNLCNKYGKPFIFKKDLLAYCDFEIIGQCKTDPRVVK